MARHGEGRGPGLHLLLESLDVSTVTPHRLDMLLELLELGASRELGLAVLGNVHGTVDELSHADKVSLLQ